jgi:plastocyanin
MSNSAWVWTIVIVIIVIIGLMFMFGKSSSKPPIEMPSQGSSPVNVVQPSTEPSITPLPEASASPTEQTSSNVTISNFAFAPATLTVNAGTTVTWTNQDSVQHNIKGSTFTSGPLKTGDTYQFTFKTPGTFNYICIIHPTMKGAVIVQ